MEDRDPARTTPRLALFRTPAPGDAYHAALSPYAPTSVPALADRLLPGALGPVLRAGAGGWEAVVITSRRAAEAWAAAAGTTALDAGAESWSAVSVYSPGPAVGSVLDAACVPTHLRPAPGPTAVSAASLAPLLLSAAPRGTEYAAYLLLTGDKTLPLLGDALAAAGRRATKVQVYATAQAPTLAANVERLPRALRWAALFSPSSAGYVLPLLEGAGFGVRPASAGRLRIAAIGETTAAFLREGGYALDAVAATPTAEGLLAAISAAETGAEAEAEAEAATPEP
ncbi:uroporphyrinogen-III synthase [Vanrija albida]|uniref:Uroporphyrinogen-III synthase n=1 Tax=Vanrija albida TaxID=181172 RepID=A0ABR3Q1G8_9TREE